MTVPARILIVDDDESMNKSMSLVLKRKGYDVSISYNGADAIEKVRFRPFDIIFMDIKMPVMDGVETFETIKKIRPDAIVMMMTAYAVEDLIQKALREGAYGIIYKPLDIEKTLAAIEDVKQKKRGDAHHGSGRRPRHNLFVAGYSGKQRTPGRHCLNRGAGPENGTGKIVRYYFYRYEVAADEWLQSILPLKRSIPG